MANVRLSSVVRSNPKTINSSLEKLTCSAKGITDVDIYPSALSALTAKGAPASVAESARTSVLVARLGCGPQQQNNGTGLTEVDGVAATRPSLLTSSVTRSKLRREAEDEGNASLDGFNIGIAMTLHTVLLSRNRIANLLGIIQFKHCVRLSLLSNRIRSIEDCEPLAMLPDLQYLSLEYNPVAQLPHYRAHILRICSWPSALSPTACHLRKLDSATVTTTEIKHAMMCLQRELSLLPELLYRMQLMAFLTDVETRQRLHHELRRRGHILQDSTERVQMNSLLERGVSCALSRVNVAGAAHMARQLVRDRHRLPSGTRLEAGRCLPSHESEKGISKEASKASDVDAPRGLATADSTMTYFGSEAFDANDLSVSAVSACSLPSEESEGNTDLLHSLSHLLANKELDWSRRSLRRADASSATHTCKAWSSDMFRQTIVSVDVRLCALLLRVSRAVGETLTSDDVDHLCNIWLHAVSHCTSSSLERESANVTGPHRPVVAQASSSTVSKRLPVRKVDIAHGGPQAPEEPHRTMLQSPPSSSLPDRFCEEAVAPTNLNRITTVAGERVQAGSPPTAEDIEPQQKNESEAELLMQCRAVSIESFSSDAVLLPRDVVPLPIARTGERQADVKQIRCIEKEEPCVTLSISTQTGQLGISASTEGASTTPAERVIASARLHRQRLLFQRWRTVLRHRWQARIATAYIREKVSVGAVAHLRSPSWAGLLTQVSYVERKRGFFAWWRWLAQQQRVCSMYRLRSLWLRWRRKAVASSLLRQACTHITILSVQHTLKRLFGRWKTKAEHRATERCALARHRTLDDVPHTLNTILKRPATASDSLRNTDYVMSSRTPALIPTMAWAIASPTETLLAVPPNPQQGPCAERADVQDDGPSFPIIKTTWRATPLRGDDRPSSVSRPPLGVGEQPSLSPTCDLSEGTAGLSSVESDAPASEMALAGSTHGRRYSAISPLVQLVSTVDQNVASPRQLGGPTGQDDALTRPLAPPPAMRTLFPRGRGERSPEQVMRPRCESPMTGAVRSKDVWPSPITPAMSLRSATYVPGQGFKVRCLPSAAAARRAIVYATDSETFREVSRCHKMPRDGNGEALDKQRDVASPYPPADVEALVQYAKQLEADRECLIETLHSIPSSHRRWNVEEDVEEESQRHEVPCTEGVVGSTPLPQQHRENVSSSMAFTLSGKEDIAQHTEICRLEQLVTALRDERHELLKSVKSDLFHY